MNATDVLGLINYWEKDIERIQASIEKIKAECSHITENGVSTVGPHEVHAIPGSAQTGTACQVCGVWITKDSGAQIVSSLELNVTVVDSANNVADVDSEMGYFCKFCKTWGALLHECPKAVTGDK